MQTKICYWNLKSIINENKYYRKKSLSFNAEIKNFKSLLERTVLKQTISDVQIGSFLSGGIDSSIITSILQKNTQKN